MLVEIQGRHWQRHGVEYQSLAALEASGGLAAAAAAAGGRWTVDGGMVMQLASLLRTAFSSCYTAPRSNAGGQRTQESSVSTLR